MNTPKNILLELKDKVYIYNIMTIKASDTYATVRSFVNLIMILMSSAMSIINSSFDANDIKIANIILNCLTALAISLISNFKIVEKANSFKLMSLKFSKLHHYIDEKLQNETITITDIQDVTRQYDDLLEHTDRIPIFVKRIVYKNYKNKKHLPFILLDLFENKESGNKAVETTKSLEIIKADIENKVIPIPTSYTI